MNPKWGAELSFCFVSCCCSLMETNYCFTANDLRADLTSLDKMDMDICTSSYVTQAAAAFLMPECLKEAFANPGSFHHVKLYCISLNVCRNWLCLYTPPSCCFTMNSAHSTSPVTTRACYTWWNSTFIHLALCFFVFFASVTLCAFWYLQTEILLNRQCSVHFISIQHVCRCAPQKWNP